MSEVLKVIIAGGRKFNSYSTLESYCKHVLRNQTNIEVVSGTAKGADSLGEEFAIKNNLGLKSFPAPWYDIENRRSTELGTTKNGGKYWKSAGFVRNKQMAEYADALIVFWDGKSKGTKSMIDLAKKAGLKIRIKRYDYGA